MILDLLRNYRKTVVEILWKTWGKLDLNQRPAGYEGGGLPHNSISSNRYELDDKEFMVKMLLDFIGF